MKCVIVSNNYVGSLSPCRSLNFMNVRQSLVSYYVESYRIVHYCIGIVVHRNISYHIAQGSIASSRTARLVKPINKPESQKFVRSVDSYASLFLILLAFVRRHIGCGLNEPYCHLTCSLPSYSHLDDWLLSYKHHAAEAP